MIRCRCDWDNTCEFSLLKCLSMLMALGKVQVVVYLGDKE
jgi:hypothetical protein